MESLLWTIAIVLGVLVLLALIFSASVWINHLLLGWKVCSQMRKAGRLITPAEFEERLASSLGTAIFELPTLGWRVLWVWWTPEDVRLAVPSESEAESSDSLDPSPLECWCRDHYTDLSTGRAFLVARQFTGRAFSRYPAKVRSSFPRMPTVTVLSAMIDLIRMEDKQQGKSTP
ncbi:hypothetical protein [Roseimicrobium sp. ORNL1]|uniref:hypothetical protein n=1 Tax=Roseimicrobium sp. ORNL1 TaxID=2711231 RepID=UPI0013E1DD84|nr:hypothetical protein [Roseimicrobium sp. ORNL1]QIF04931.1 hypothetical protein G5S37_26585 [Roseimicrobium sp. ORNL1]